MQKIDIHTHILPPEIPRFKEKFGYGGFIHLEKSGPSCARMLRDDGKFFRDVESNCWDPETRIKEFRQDKVALQVISTVPVMFNYWTKGDDGLAVARFLNDHIHSVVSAHAKHFIGLGTLPMQAPKLAVKELERCVRDLKFPGVQIGSHVNDWNLSDPALFPVFKAAEELGACIFVHPWDMMGQDKMAQYWLPWLVGMPAETSLAICSMIFGGIFERLPKLRVAFAHGGGAFPITVGRVQHGFQMRPDLCAVDCKTEPREFLGKFFVDSLVHDQEALKFVVNLIGSNRVVLGSDYPFPLGEDHPGALIESVDSFSDSVKKKLLYSNAVEWLGASAVPAVCQDGEVHAGA